MIDEPSTNDPPSSDESAADFHLAPLKPGALDELKAASALERSNDNEPPSEPPVQFSLGEFLLWIAVVSIGLSGLAWVPPTVFAGVCGFLALALLIVTLIWNPDAPLFQLVWYALLFMYMISIIIALAAPTLLSR